MSEPAIMVKRPGRSGQVWSMEKLDNKLVDMREMYDEWRQRQQRNEVEPEEVIQINAIFNLLDQLYCSYYFLFS